MQLQRGAVGVVLFGAVVVVVRMLVYTDAAGDAKTDPKLSVLVYAVGFRWKNLMMLYLGLWCMRNNFL